MIRLIAHKVTVVRDETTRLSREVWAWELPILEAKHPEGYVIDEGETVEIEREEAPVPAEELARLDKVYGTEADSNRRLAELIYGYRAEGVSKLGKLIEAAIVKPGGKKAATKKKVAAKKPAGSDE